MRIYADENIEKSIIEGLRRRKVGVISAKELGYAGKPDEFHIKKASELKAVILLVSLVDRMLELHKKNNSIN